MKDKKIKTHYSFQTESAAEHKIKEKIQ